MSKSDFTYKVWLFVPRGDFLYRMIRNPKKKKKVSLTIFIPSTTNLMAKRTTFTNRQRSALRTQHKLKPHLTRVQLQKWFEDEYKQRITLPSISRILSTKFDWLQTANDFQLDAKLHRIESWPELEVVLYQWIQLAGGQTAISQELVREKARQFWPSLYPGAEMPQFSNGWLQGFQNRRNIRSNGRHREERSLGIDANEEMIKICKVIKNYSPKDIFSCDETGLFWMMMPNKDISHSIPEQDKNNARIILHFCTNSDGSERLPIWIIGNEEKPHALQVAGIDIENLGCNWRCNENASMTEQIFEEWLYWFDMKMAGRNVILLMDKFSPHQLAVRKVSSQLQNTLVGWLPTTSATKYQPLNQGVIHTWKAYWKRQWLLHIMMEYNLGNDPVTTMTIITAIRWAVQAWCFELSQETIQISFRKAFAGQNNIEMVNEQLLEELQTGLNQLSISMNVDQFLSPAEEEVLDSLEDLDRIILSQANIKMAESDDNDGAANESHEELSKVSVKIALKCLDTMRLYEGQQAKMDQRILKDLLRYEDILIERNIQDDQADIQFYD